MSSHVVRLTAIQTSPRFLDVSTNRNQIEQALRRVRRSDLVVLPELATSGYHFRTRADVAKVAENAERGETLSVLVNAARHLKCNIVAGFPEKRGNRFYNSAWIVSPRKVQVYRKNHLFFKEKKFFSPGQKASPVFKGNGFKFGVLICFDWFFPEATRSLALAGADVIAHPSNLVMPYAPRGMKIRSLENLVYSVTANRVGEERDLRYIGQSQILDVRGEVLARLGLRAPGMVTVSVDIKKARDKNLTPFNHIFRDRQKRRYSI